MVIGNSSLKCPRCGRAGSKRYKGYCTKVHYKLDHRKPQKLKLPCKGCGAIQLRNPSSLAPSGNVFCKNCGKNRGEFHPRWKEGQYISDDGYRYVLINGSYLREHRVIWEEANLACLIPWASATIHHIDFDKLNNDPNNLLLLSNENHGRLHRFIEAGKRGEVAGILRSAAQQQVFNPEGVEVFICSIYKGKIGNKYLS